MVAPARTVGVGGRPAPFGSSGKAIRPYAGQGRAGASALDMHVAPRGCMQIKTRQGESPF